MRFFAVALILFGAAASYAQAPQVPHKMHFANMTLAIRDDARREIQADVDALTRYTRHFQMRVERAKTYFPIISRIFAEEDLPDDFKYLVLQESALVPDAVSVSNAVGFWQFKDFTALSMGLRVDKEIDERMNIASASRGAANYLKQNNQQFDNWLLALQAYQMGAGGLKRSIGDKHNGKRHMDITSESYWYVKKFIAHKVAFEQVIEGDPQVKVVLFESKKFRSIADLATELQVEEELLREYNKWALKGLIPDDKSYTVVVPTNKPIQDFSSLVLASDKSARAKPISDKAKLSRPDIKFVNGLRAIKAAPSESLVSLTDRAGIALSRFLRFNEMSIDQNLVAGEYYFLEKKKSKGEALQHKVKPGEDLWTIAQTYGIRVSKLEKWNKISRHEKLGIGSFVKLNPKVVINPAPTIAIPSAPVVAPLVTSINESVQQVKEVAHIDEETFNWEVRPTEKPKEMLTATPAVDSVKLAELSTASDHLVLKGETLYSIAKLYSVKVAELLEWNNLEINQALKPGQKLLLKDLKNNKKVHARQPISTGIDIPQINEHTVAESDTLYSIARQYNVTIKDLMDWNQKTELTVRPGEKLKVKAR
jgi:membrane-bound lytic murein transglycosylase D